MLAAPAIIRVSLARLSRAVLRQVKRDEISPYQPVAAAIALLRGHSKHYFTTIFNLT